MSISNINADKLQVLQSMQEMERRISNIEPVKTVDSQFSDYLNQALQSVNEAQQSSDALKSNFERSEEMSLGEMMLHSQKTTEVFNTLMQFSKRFINVYEEIMNMPV